MTLVAAALLLFFQNLPAKASIEGVVVRAGTSEPISRARVTVSRSGAGAGMVAVNTDEQGHFIVKDVDAGTYFLAAQRNGFARQMYGERSIGRPGTPINISAGQSVKDIVFRLTPAGAVTGRVTDVTGEPLSSVTVQLWRATYQSNGERKLEQVGSAPTNDRGEYRLFFVTPGRYFVSGKGARPGPLLNDRVLQDHANEVIDPGYGLTYYPGTRDASGAVSIEVHAGEDLSAIDFTLRQEKVFRIRGRLIDSVTGQIPKSAQVLVSPRSSLSRFPDFSSTTPSDYNSADGTFQIRDLLPGSYWVQAFSETGTGQGSRMGLSASVAVDVSETDIENVIVAFTPGFSIDGRVSVEDGTPFSSVPDSYKIQVLFAPNTSAGPIVPNPFSPVSKDGSFKVENLHPGEYRIALRSMPSGTYMKEARLGQLDIRNSVSIAGPVSARVEILLGLKAGEVAGTILDAERNPARSVEVVLIPSDRALHDSYRTAVTDSNGQFSIRSIIPGDYKLFAWEDIEPYAYTDPDFLRRYEELGIPVRISESSKERLEARLITAGR